MSTLIILIIIAAVVVAVISYLLWRNQHPSHRMPAISFPGATSRKLSADERSAVEHYLEYLNRSRQMVAPSGSSPAPAPLALASRSSSVVCITRSITRYGFSTDDANKWRYYLDSIEVHLPPFWEQYISSDNTIELIQTDAIPLVISLNGHELTEYVNDESGYTLETTPVGQSFIRGEESEQIELLNIRQETREEHSLNRPDGLREAFLIITSFALMFLCLVLPGVFVPWLAGGALVLMAAGLWGLYAPPAHNTRREIHCLRGTPKRWGLFGESDQDQASNISLGIIDLIYPDHWRPFVANNLGHKTDIDIYLDRHVVRQGPFLSLNDEVKNFPLQFWMRNLIIAIGALVVLIMLMIWVPLQMPLKLSVSWLKGAQTIEVNQVGKLDQAGVRVGDTLMVSGTGMCSIHTLDTPGSRLNAPFAPFDCSQIIWNPARPLPVPESETVNKAQALADAVNEQLHPQMGDQSNINPQLASAIQKSGMILLNDFADIVLKTKALCTGNDECVRLKNALINLGNTKDWDTLTRRASAGKLDGINLLLRPVSAESLDNLVITSTAPFFIRETQRAAQSLNSPAPGGFVISSDEENDLVDQPYPPMSLYDYPPSQQWTALQKLASSLLNTPFSAEGIVTSITVDANNTRHIALHSIPDSAGVWRYNATTLLLLAMVVALAWNSVMAVRRYQRHQQRYQAIQAYYEESMNQKLITGPDHITSL